MEGKIVLVLLLVGTAACAVMKSDSDSCDVDPMYRSDCGWLGIDEDTCVAKECCWDDSISDKPYCYFSTGGAVASCIIGPKPKTDCGWDGINNETCQKRGCCWAEADPGTPWCYVKDFGNIPYGTCRTAPADRTDCGEVGITKDECLGKGCCYDDSYDDGATPWCFNPPDTYPEPTYCDLEYTSGSCKYVCDPETEPDYVYGLCTEGRVCCYKNFMGRR